MNNGYIKLSRTFFTSELWRTARTYNESEAWLDLIQSARFEASEHTARVGGRDITWGRGQYPASIRFLSSKWHWNERKVRNFISKLKKNEMITTDDKQGMNVITLVNFEKYNNCNTSCDTAIDTVNTTANDTNNDLNINELTDKLTQQITQRLTQKLTQRRHSVDTKNNKDKESKERKEYKEPPLSPPNVVEKSEADEALKKSLCTSENEDYIKFRHWMSQNAPYCDNPKNFSSSRITEEEFNKLKESFTGFQIAETIMQIENRKDLRKKYTNLYRTVLNWIKPGDNGIR